MTFNEPFATIPAVFVTPMNGGNYTVQDVTVSSFVIMLPQAATADMTFSWMAAEIDPSAVNNGEQIEAPVMPIAPPAGGEPTGSELTGEI